MKFLEPMIVAFSMYSKIPMPRIEWNKENMKYTMCFFPLIGVVTGVLIYLAGMFLDGNIFPKVNSGRLMFAAVMTLIPVFVSGGGKEETFICACGYKEKLSAFQARRAKEGAGVNKRDVQKYMRQQQKEAKEPVNNAFAQALAGLKLE